MRPEWDAPAGPDQVRCAETGCERGVWHDPGRGGRRPTKCPRHARRAPDPATELAPLEQGGAASERSHQRRREQRREAAALAGLPLFAAFRLAVGLETYPGNLRQAARLGGVMLPAPDGKTREPTDDELEQLLEQAAGVNVKGLTQTQLVGLLRTLEFKIAVGLMEAESDLKPEQRPFALRLLQQTIEDLGGKRATYATYSKTAPRVRGAAKEAG